MKRILFTILFVLFLSDLSLAEVYRWVDDKGVVYFTDDISQVPERYRSKAERVGVDEDKEKIKSDGELQQKREEIYRDRLGRGEDYWKGRVEEWRKKLRESQGKLETQRTKYNELTEKFNDSRSTAERANVRRERDQVKTEMDRIRLQVEEAKEMIERKIPEEAEIYKAKPEWIK